MDEGRSADLVVPRIAVRGLSKAFGSKRVLNDVNMDIVSGRIHGLAGENGSGKSTLIKLLTGVYEHDGGSIQCLGQGVNNEEGWTAYTRQGIACVYQDVPYAQGTTALETARLLMGGNDRQTSRSRLGRIRWGKEVRYYSELLRGRGLDLDLRKEMSTLRPVERAMLYLVAATERARRGRSVDQAVTLILDEPTAFLPHEDRLALFTLIRGLATEGCLVLIVSHDIPELLKLCDDLTILRDGEVQYSGDSASVTLEQCLRLMIGDSLLQWLHASEERSNRPPSGNRETSQGVPGVADDPAVLRVRRLAGERLRRADFEIRSGETLGVTGLAGSGFEEIPYILFGARRGTEGELQFAGETSIHTEELTLQIARAMGMALVPGDRHALGGIMSLSAGENIMIERLRTFYHWRLKRRGVTEAAAEVMRSLDVRPPDPALQLGLMSGGNQQKALFGRWLGGEPRILLMHEPTQGVDIAARSRIFSMIRAYVADGNAALCASIDYEQLVTLCDRVMIIADGQQVRMVEGDELSTEELLRVVQESRVAV